MGGFCFGGFFCGKSFGVGGGEYRLSAIYEYLGIFCCTTSSHYSEFSAASLTNQST